MADYYPVLTRAISGLDPNTAESRRAVYERARSAIVKQLRAYDPPLTESEITRERLALEEAVRRIEAEARAASAPKPAIAQAAEKPPAASAPSSSYRPAPARPAGNKGLTQVHAAAAAAASLGAATSSAQASASTTRGADSPPAARYAPPRTEPNFERPKVPGPVPDQRDRMEPRLGDADDDQLDDDPNPHLREPHFEPEKAARTKKKGAPVGLIVLAALIGLAIAGFFARDQISAMLGGGTQVAQAPQPTSEPAVSDVPKIEDRVGGAPVEDEPAEVAPTPQPEEPATQIPSVTTQPRAILYDEAPDQQGGALSNGTVTWRAEPLPDNPAETRLIGEINVPERSMVVSFSLTRNLDPTLPASHVIEISFNLPADFANGGIGNVPGILFKPTEDAGGSALKGMSVKVTKNLFWIGLESTPADREQNFQAMRTRGWIDIPILYENGRRAVLTVEKGPTGETAFQQAFAAWEAGPEPQ